MIKVLFLIHDLGHGGAEKVLVNLANNMNPSVFDVTVITLFGGGVNEQFLLPHIKKKSIWKKSFPGNSHILKLFSPGFLHRICTGNEKYDIEVSYLEGVSARIISGCNDNNTKLLCWIHSTKESKKYLGKGFRNVREAVECYLKYNKLVFVSNGVRDAFCKYCPIDQKGMVLYNTNESKKIHELKENSIEEELIQENEFSLVSVGKISFAKGVDVLARCVFRLRNEGIPAHLYLIGDGPDKEKISQYLEENQIEQYVTFLGYQTNPYKYVARCDLFVCASKAEGFSTATTEALIVGTPVCTVDVSGMKEMLGDNCEYGVVTENNEDALFLAIKNLYLDKEKLKYYRKQSAERGKIFSTQSTVNAVEEMMKSMIV